MSAVQALPFQLRIVPDAPTALQKVVRAQLTAFTTTPEGMVSAVHVAPFQERIPKPAAALQNVAERQLTPDPLKPPPSSVQAVPSQERIVPSELDPPTALQNVV